MLRKCSTAPLLALIVLLAGSSAWAESPSVLLEKGIYQEETAGDLDGAIKVYQQIIEQTEAHRPYVAKAMYRLGKCYLKKGQRREAVGMFRRLLNDYADQKAIHDDARRELAKLGEFADGARQRHFVKLVIGEDRMTFQGKDVQWEELPDLLDGVPDRRQTVLEVGIVGDVPASRLQEALGLAKAHGLEYGSYIGRAELGAMGSPKQQIPATPPASSEVLKAKLINWIEDFFSRNYRDITARKTLEWGEPETAANGNLAIRYKYLATIWHKDKLIIEQRFTFSPEGEYVSAETIGKGPAPQPGLAASAPAMTIAESFISALRDDDVDRALRLLSKGSKVNKPELAQFPLLMDFSTAHLIKARTDDKVTRTAFGPIVVKADRKRFFLCVALVRDDRNMDSWAIKDAYFQEDEDADDLKSVMRFVEHPSPTSSQVTETAEEAIRLRQAAAVNLRKGMDLSSPEATVKAFTVAASRGDKDKAMACVLLQSHDYDDIARALSGESGDPMSALFAAIDPDAGIEVKTKTLAGPREEVCEIAWSFRLKSDVTIGKGPRATYLRKGDTFTLDGNLKKVGGIWLINGI